MGACAQAEAGPLLLAPWVLPVVSGETMFILIEDGAQILHEVRPGLGAPHLKHHQSPHRTVEHSFKAIV